MLESVKAIYWNRDLQVLKYTPSHLAYTMAKESLVLEDLQLNLLLPSTEPYKTAVDQRWQKQEEIWEEFYTADTMTNRNWMEANYGQWHTVTRFAVHGWHHKICKRVYFHTPEVKCVCSYLMEYVVDISS
jgi:hypothetical protein